jgi:hypothetical protein
MFRELARTTEVREALLGAAQAGANAARANAPTYSGPTYNPAVSRHGEYKASIYSAASMQPNGWRAEFGAAAPWALQVEFGTGGGAADPRPQSGWSPKWRVLGRALDSLRR